VDDACKDIYCWAQVEEQDEPFGKMRIESYTVRVIATPILVGGISTQKESPVNEGLPLRSLLM